MALRAVLFDLDGVLIDSQEAWFDLMNAAARAFRVPGIAWEELQRTWGQSVEEDARHFYAGRSAAEVAAFYQAHFLEHAERLRVAEGAGYVLERLRRAGLRTGLVTNTPRPLAVSILERVGLRLEAIVAGGDTPRAKPAPEPVLLGCRLLETAPGLTLMVGDSVHDWQAARAAGAHFAGMGAVGEPPLLRLVDVLAWVDRAQAQPLPLVLHVLGPHAPVRQHLRLVLRARRLLEAGVGHALHPALARGPGGVALHAAAHLA